MSDLVAQKQIVAKMSAEAEIHSDRPLYDTTAGKVSDPQDEEPPAKRQRKDSQNDGYDHQGPTRILVLQDLGDGQQVLVEASPGDVLTPLSESAGLHTLAETAALEIPATSLSEGTISLIQQGEGQGQDTISVIQQEEGQGEDTISLIQQGEGQGQGTISLIQQEEGQTQQVYITTSTNSSSTMLTPGQVTVPQPKFVVKPAVRQAVQFNSNRQRTANNMRNVDNQVKEPHVAESYNAPTAEEEEVEDTHRCGKCGIEFTTLEEYIKHKLYGNKCRMKSKTVVSGRGILRDDIGDTELDLGALLRPRGRGRGRGRPRGRGRGRGRGSGRGQSSRDNSVNYSNETRPTPKMKHKRMSLIHTEDNIYVHEQYQCPNCDKTFRREAALNRHVEYDHVKREDSGDEAEELDEDQTEDYTVEPNSAASAGSDLEEDEEEQEETDAVLEVHAKQPNVKSEDYMKRPYGCNVCKARFKEICVLRAHLLTHSDKREFRCRWENCPFAFKTKGSLKRHMRRHTGERPFKCDQCNRSFRESGALTRHQRSRTPCSNKADSDLPRYGKQADLVMPLTMLRSVQDGDTGGVVEAQDEARLEGTLTNLQELATGQAILGNQQSLLNVTSLQGVVVKGGEQAKSNQCRVCLVTIDDKEMLRQHLKTHLAQTPYRCELCTYSTDKQADLILHRQITHHIQHAVNEEEVSAERGEDLVVMSDLPIGSEQGVVEQVLEQYINQGHDLNDLSGETTATAIINGEEVQVHIIRADSVMEDGLQQPSQQLIVQLQTNKAENVSQQVSGESTTDEQPSEFVDPLVVEPIQEEPMEADIQLSVSEVLPITEEMPVTAEVTDSEHMLVSEQASINEQVLVTEEDQQTEQYVVTTEGTVTEEFPVTVEVTGADQEDLIMEAQDSEQIESTQVLEEVHVTDADQNTEELNVDEQCSDQQITKNDQVESTEGIHVDSKVLAGGDAQTGHQNYTNVEVMPTTSTSEEAAEQTLLYTQAVQGISEQNQQLPNSGNSTSDSGVDKQTREAAVALQQLLELRDGAEEEEVQRPGVHGYKAVHRCPVCQRTFRGSSYLRLHMRSHTGERPYHCEECDKTFATKDTLTKHMVAHSSDRRYKCGECGKMFKRISHVHEHLRIHSSDRPYPCHYCDKTFKAPNACKVHLRTHTEELQWECPTCHRLFREKGSMDRHMRIHTGEKPYKCQHCGRSFSEHGTLSRHLKAKFPCTRQLQILREQQVGHNATEVTEGTSEIQEEVSAQTVELQEGQVAVEVPPSLLAEFSSLAADTQQYIIQTEEGSSTPTEQGTTQYVMVTADGQEQALEVITEGEEGSGLQNAQIVLLDDGNITLRMGGSEEDQSGGGAGEQLLTVMDENEQAQEQLVMVVDALQQEVVAQEVEDEGQTIEMVVGKQEEEEQEVVMGQDVVHEAMIEATLVDMVHGEVVEEQVIS